MNFPRHRARRPITHARCTACGSQCITAGSDPDGGVQITCLSCGHHRHVDGHLLPAGHNEIAEANAHG